MKKYKTLIAIVSILFIKFLYVIKGLPPMDINVLLPIFFTCLIVNVGKITIYYGMVLGTKGIINKLKNNNNDEESNYEQEKTKILENNKEEPKENLIEFSYEENIKKDKPKVLVKKKNQRGRL